MYIKKQIYNEVVGEPRDDTKDVELRYEEDGFMTAGRTYHVRATYRSRVAGISKVPTLKLARRVGQALATALLQN